MSKQELLMGIEDRLTAISHESNMIRSYLQELASSSPFQEEVQFLEKLLAQNIEAAADYEAECLEKIRSLEAKVAAQADCLAANRTSYELEAAQWDAERRGLVAEVLRRGEENDSLYRKLRSVEINYEACREINKQNVHQLSAYKVKVEELEAASARPQEVLEIVMSCFTKMLAEVEHSHQKVRDLK